MSEQNYIKARSLTLQQIMASEENRNLIRMYAIFFCHGRYMEQLLSLADAGSAK